MAERARVGQAPGPQRGIAFSELANGFASCERPERLQAICDRFGPADVQGFFDRWMAVIPTPLTADDQAAGYFVGALHAPGRGVAHPRLRRPSPGPRFFEALVADNIGVGRPEEVPCRLRPTKRGADHP